MRRSGIMEDSLSHDVYRTLKYTHRQLKKDLRKKLTDYGVTWPQFHALYHLEEEGIPVNELAQDLHCNASNITGLIDRMRENGWVCREHSEEDRRVWLVKLTDEGINFKNKIYPEHLKNIKERMQTLSDNELITLKKLLRKLINGVEEGE